MNKLELQLRFWETVYHFVIKEEYRIVFISHKNQEVWLEDERNEPFKLIRLALRDFDWRNELQQDIEKGEQRGRQIRKRFGLPKQSVFNIIFSPFAPVDSYDDLVGEAYSVKGGGKEKQRTILIPSEELSERLASLTTELNFKAVPSYRTLDSHDHIDKDIYVLKSSLQQFAEAQVKKEKDIFFYGKPKLTYLLLIINLIIFLLVELNGSSTSTETLIAFGAKFNPFILDGEWWRFITAMFLHIGALHLIMNGIALYYLGSAVERIYGSGRFFVIYMIAGLAGSIASFSFNEQVSAGASGAIFGLFGALLYFGVRHKRLFFRTMGMNVIVILLINLVFGMVTPMIDNGAHVGGLIGGFFASAIVGMPKSKNRKASLAASLATIIGFASLMSYGYAQEETTQTYVVYFQLGLEKVEKEGMTEAQTFFDLILQADEELVEPLLLDTYFYSAYTKMYLNDLHGAEENLLKTIELDVEDHYSEAHFNLSLVYYQLGRIDESLEQIQIALEEDPSNSDYEKLEENIRSLNIN